MTNYGPPQNGRAPVPIDIRDIIFRLASPDAEGMVQTTRVENEVATIHLTSAALAGFVPRVVPSVYAWGSAATEPSQGWIIQVLMPGTPLNKSLGVILPEASQEIFAQMAKLLKALQDYKLPTSITGFGGVTFDGNGHIVSTTMTSVGDGPWPTYEASFKGCLKVILRKADANPYIKRWQCQWCETASGCFCRAWFASTA